MTEPESETHDTELLTCPDCDESLTLIDPIESTGEGIAFGYVACEDVDCEFRAREEWVHDQTVRTN